jgi:hypothetical protein
MEIIAMPGLARQKRAKAVPKQPYTTRGQRRILNVTLPPGLIEELDAQAKREMRSRANLIALLLREGLDRRA